VSDITLEPPVPGPLLAVSPHLDDVALSCAGLIASVPGATVITVFAGYPPGHPESVREAITPWDAASGFALGDDVVAIRRDEDRAALGHLGAVPLWLDFLDSQYTTEPATVPVIAAGIASALAGLRIETIAFPLGLSHTDHERTHEACVWLLEEFPALAANWVAFTDVPYRARFRTQAVQRLEHLGELGYDLEPLSFDLGDRKAAALAEYPSQLKALASDMENAALPEECYLLRRR
jgi:LmbE family N-acetylglucosaminyl deacetylase